jgi:hypothetical protein
LLRIDCYIFAPADSDKRDPKLFLHKPGGPGAPARLGPGSGAAPQPLEPPKKTAPLEAVPFTELAAKDARPARQLRPAHMAIIAAAFPYRKQLDEFRLALRLETREDLLAATGRIGGDRTVPAFRFLGVDFQRRTVDVAGKPTSSWAAVDLAEAYRPWVLLTGKRFEPDPPLLVALSPAGLVMPRLLAFHTPDGNSPYPDLEVRLPLLARSMKTADEAAKPGQRLPAGPAEEPGPPERPGGKKAPFIPEHCLLRVIDPTIEFGKVYQYRLRARMGNPNQNRKDAPAALAKAEELRSAKWFEVPQRVALPRELAYYAVDPHDDRRGRIRPGGRIDPARQTLLEVHRWLDTVRLDADKEPLYVGDWAIAEGVIVSRGEYVRATQDIELPVWSCLQEALLLPADSHGRKNKKETIRVSFDSGKGDSPLVVDFDGGARSYRPSPQELRTTGIRDGRIVDVGPSEFLLMTSDGKLVGHNSAADREDPERVARREALRKRIDSIKKARGEGSPFGR